MAAWGRARTPSYMQQQIERSWPRKNRIDLTKPFEELPKKTQNAAAERRRRLPGHPAACWTRRSRASSEGYREWLTEYMSPVECPACHGKRLRPASLAVRVKSFSIAEFTAHADCARADDGAQLGIHRARDSRSPAAWWTRSGDRLEFLSAVGLDYLSLDRSAATLSGGEAQRIRLATQIGSKLRGVLYVLDEPSIGLHPRDNDRLLETLTQLRDMGNTVLVVEHDAETIERADYVIDLGPGAGRLGGELVAAGTPAADRSATRRRSPGSIFRARCRFRCPRRGARPNGKKLVDPRRARAQSEGHRCRDSAGHC